MDKAHIIQIFICLFVLPFVVLPAMGGGAISVGYRMAKLPTVQFFRSWKIYLASCCYGFLFLIPAGFLLRNSEIGVVTQQIIQLAVFCGTQIVLVPIFLRSFTWRSLGVTTAAVIITNFVGYVLFTSQQS